MKKIIFFSKNLEIGGMEKALVILLNNLIKDYEITLVLEEKKGCLLNDLDEKIIVKEYKLSNLKFGLFRKMVNFLKRFFWKIKNYHKYDFSCNYATYSIIGSRLAQIAAQNSALYVHSDYHNVYKQDEELIKKFFEPHYLEKFQNIIFVSNESCNNFLKVYKKYKNNVRVINNLIDYENILEFAKEKVELKMFKKENYNLLFVGRLDNTSKNFELLIESFNKICQLRKNVHLFILGEGAYLDNIKKMINAHSLKGKVTFLGQHKNPYPYMKKCDGIVMTSRYEGFPVVYTEALVLNKKVFTTIAVSDNYIDVRDYFTILPIDKNEIADIIIKEEKKHVDYNIDYVSYNKNNLQNLMLIIEGSVK